MATLSNKNGRRFIQFPAVAGGRRRSTIRLGKLTAPAAAIVLGHVEALLAHRQSNQPVPPRTAEWLAGIGEKLYGKLVKTGIVKPRADASLTRLGSFLDRYIKSRTDLKRNTIENLTQARNGLVEYFGAARDITTITRGDINDWHRSLKAKELAPATIAMHVKKSRQMLADAVDRELLAKNPLAGLKAGKMSNAERMRYVPAAHVQKVIDEQCPDAEWRAIFALARFGGLRVPSETDGMLLSDIDLVNDRLLVRSPKTAHHPGKSTRQIPIFPELREALEDLVDIAEEGQTRAFRKLRGENLRTTAAKIIRRAGLDVWPKLFQNMRSSRETDLAAGFPLHVVCAWLGNTEAVALRHYLQVTDADFERAAKGETSGPRAAQTVAERKKENARKIQAFSGEAYALVPPREMLDPREFARILRTHRKALQKLLARLRHAAPHIMRAELAKLQQQVDAAKVRAAGRGLA